jgi:hypothetical protein
MTDTNLTDVELDGEDTPNTGEAQEAAQFSLEDTDFDLEADYKESPLAPAGTYNGIVKLVEYNPKLHAIVWTVVATGNPGIFLTDGETPLDGTDFEYMNWLPKPGEENIRSGKSNKKQNKINMMKTFQDNMKIDMNTKEKIAEAISENQWIGISVIMKVEVTSWNERLRNQVGNMQRSDDEFELPAGSAPF